VGRRSGFSNGKAASGDASLSRIMGAARTHAWGLAPGPSGGIMATRESGQIGQPFVVLAARGGSGMRVSLYRPGDAIEAEGDAIGELTGNPREMGRQLRAILEDLPEGDPTPD
jgi:hypothetical protein